MKNFVSQEGNRKNLMLEKLYEVVEKIWCWKKFSRSQKYNQKFDIGENFRKWKANEDFKKN